MPEPDLPVVFIMALAFEDRLWKHTTPPDRYQAILGSFWDYSFTYPHWALLHPHLVLYRRPLGLKCTHHTTDIG